MPKTILITGGAGFIGSNLTRHLYDKYPGYKLIVLDSLTYAGNAENFTEEMKGDPRFSFWYGDVRNGDLVQELVAKSDVVLHLAAESHVARSIFDNKIFFETDVLGTQVVANAVLKNCKKVERFIHFSSSEVYGTAIKNPMDENHPLNPMSPYAGAKAGADRLVYSYYHTYKIPAAIVRPFNNYGPNQHLEKAIPRFITSAILGEPLTVHGPGESERDWVFVKDICEAMDILVHCNFKKVEGETINLGTGKSISVNSVAKTILKLLNKPDHMVKHVGERPGQVKKHIASTQKARELISWEAKTNFEEGLKQTIDWYQNNRSWWEKLLWMKTIPIVATNGEVEYH